MKKLLHEQLESGAGKSVRVHVNGRLVWFDWEEAKALAAEIKRQYFPRLRYKDGGSVQLGGAASFDGNDFEIEKTIYYKGGLVTICEMSGNGHSYMPGDFVERPTDSLEKLRDDINAWTENNDHFRTHTGKVTDAWAGRITALIERGA